MFKIVTKADQTYLVNSIKDKPSGVIFEYNGELLMLKHADIKSIDSAYVEKSVRTHVRQAH